jgi:transcriptional regulator of NAD metabolism
MSHNEEHNQAKHKLLELFDDVLTHDGFGEIRVEMKILKRKQKEVILHCGKQYRFVIDTPATEGQ